jgi:dual specificity MAP kinase phosphatase
MYAMSKASEIANNVWLGPTPDPNVEPTLRTEDGKFDVLIEASDLAQMPEDSYLRDVANRLEDMNQVCIEFPSSGSIMPSKWCDMEVEGIIGMCKWIYELANPNIVDELEDAEYGKKTNEKDIVMKNMTPRKGRRILIHCTDGYTESTLLALVYFMFANGLPVHEAWIRLHCEKQRNFFAYPPDVELLRKIQNVLFEDPNMMTPHWLEGMDGSLPSRILPYMYLGNLGHANNPDLLRALGINQILSVGEIFSWEVGEEERWGRENIMFVERIQDNGVDPLTGEFERCLEFIGKLCFSSLLLYSFKPGYSEMARHSYRLDALTI